MIRAAARLALALFYFAAGVIHIASPRPFLIIMPQWVPAPEAVVLWTGIAELLGAVGLAQGVSLPIRRAASIGLALYAVCVFPANINHFAIDLAKPDHGAGLAYHVPRMFAQPVLVWLALWAGGVIEWPWKPRTR
ncbi:DoxX family protein [Novosphingobium sp. CCH12-A3]|uniref:DoxX family protein n=1 Tax=Novosphingobium sp. CCH12-A3 TaxID=1768752 RepID=UPI000784FF6A|nr:DoxX family protein [Novosphingobium sp. CCH12-A3]